MRSYTAFLASEARWLLFGLLLTFTSSLGQTFFISLFGQDIREELQLGHAGFANIYAIGTIFGSIVLFWIGRTVDHVSLHLVTGFTLAGLALAGMMLASAHGMVLLTLAIFMLRLCGQGMSTHIAITCMARWFARNRGKAISIASLGQPLGEALLPPLVVSLLAGFYWRDAWWLFAAVLALGLVPLSLALVWRGERQPRSGIDDIDEPDEVPSWTRAEVLRDRRFWMIVPAATGPAWIFTGVFFLQVAITAAKGWDFSAFAFAYLAYAVTKVTASLLTGLLIDHASAKRIAPFTMPVMALALVILALATDPLAAWPFMIVVGVHIGMHQTCMSALWPELYGRRHLGAIKALAMSMGVFASALGPPIFGYSLDTGTDPAFLLVACAVYAVVAAGMTFVAVRR
ncbi:MAG: MFS transporter [Geminicoccaceae bacterium]